MAQSQGAEARGMGADRQPTQEELQAYVEQMRRADVAEIVAQAFQVLAMGAEVKLGRSDARVLIDSLSALIDTARGRVPADLTTGMRNAVSQLQTAQVQAERAAAQEGSADTAEAAQATSPGEPAGQARASDAQRGQQPGDQSSAAGGEGQKLTDRLWIPGR